MSTPPLPARVEERLAALKRMDEFDDEEIAYCRQSYWTDRDCWHTILINCFNRAQARLQAQGGQQ